MEQDERRELEGAMPASGTPEEEPGKTAVQEGRETTRRNILHLLAGICCISRGSSAAALFPGSAKTAGAAAW
mgnify:CR=1 FL=1